MELAQLQERLTKRFPRLHCQELLELDHWTEIESNSKVYEVLKTSLAQRRFGLPDVAQESYDFARICQDPSIDLSGHEQVEFGKTYAAILAEVLTFYPRQLDLLVTGIIALLRIYQRSPERSVLTQPYVECFTTLLAVPELTSPLIASLALLIEQSKVEVINTDLVDILIEILKQFKDKERTISSLKILGLESVGHRKSDQYHLFFKCLKVWRSDTEVLRCVLTAITEFAKRGSIEAFRLQQRSPRQSPFHSSEESHTNRELREQPILWMPPDGSDIKALIDVMKLYPENMEIIIEVLKATSSLMKVSRTHCLEVLKALNFIGKIHNKAESSNNRAVIDQIVEMVYYLKSQEGLNIPKETEKEYRRLLKIAFSRHPQI